jgi:conjugal transfer pilus assembly protein TrbC
MDLASFPAHGYKQHNLESSVKQLLEQTKKQAEQMQLPPNIHTQAGQQTAEHAFNNHISPGSQKCTSKQQTDIRKQFLGEEEEQEQRNRKASNDTERLYFFFSSSIPVSIVQSYLVDIHTLRTSNVIPVMHGLIGDSKDLTATVNFFDAITLEDPTCKDPSPPGNRCPRFNHTIRIDPLFFERFHISKVPALVYENADTTINIEGAVPLAMLIEGIRQKTDSQFLDTLANKLDKQ